MSDTKTGPVGNLWRGVAHMVPMALASWSIIFLIVGWTSTGIFFGWAALAALVVLMIARRTERRRHT